MIVASMAVISIREMLNRHCHRGAANAESSSYPTSFASWAAIQGAKLWLRDNRRQSPDPALRILPCRIVHICNEILHAVLAARGTGLRARGVVVKRTHGRDDRRTTRWVSSQLRAAPEVVARRDNLMAHAEEIRARPPGVGGSRIELDDGVRRDGGI